MKQLFAYVQEPFLGICLRAASVAARRLFRTPLKTLEVRENPHFVVGWVARLAYNFCLLQLCSLLPYRLHALSN